MEVCRIAEYAQYKRIKMRTIRYPGDILTRAILTAEHEKKKKRTNTKRKKK